jgi:rubrerythrin
MAATMSLEQIEERLLETNCELGEVVRVEHSGELSALVKALHEDGVYRCTRCGFWTRGRPTNGMCPDCAAVKAA